MMKTKITDNGYITAAGDSLVGGTPITEEEYSEILNILHGLPEAPTGYEYRIREDLTAELAEAEIHEDPEAEATEDDYIASLESLGVSFDG